CVVMRSAGDLTIRIDQLPVFSAVVGAPQLPALRRLAIHRHAIACFDQRINTIRVLRRHAHRDSSHGRLWQPVAFQPLPRHSPVRGFKQSAARSSTGSSISVNFQLPHPSQENPHIISVHPHTPPPRFFLHPPP